MEYVPSKLCAQATQFCGVGTQRIALIMSNGFGGWIMLSLSKEVECLLANRHVS